MWCGALELQVTYEIGARGFSPGDSGIEVDFDIEVVVLIVAVNRDCLTRNDHDILRDLGGVIGDNVLAAVA